MSCIHECTREIHAGVALGQYLAICKDSINTAYKQTSNLSGLPGALDPYLWIFFLTGAFTNTPALRPTVAFLPGNINQNTQECLLHCQSADAVAQAERMFAAFVATDPQSNGTLHILFMWCMHVHHASSYFPAAVTN